MNKNISIKMTYFYFLLTIAMVMYHARWLFDYNIKYSNIIDQKILSFYFFVAEHMGTVCMVFFFFASAFWFYRGIKDIKDVLKKWKKRILTLLVPFLLWTVILAIYKICLGEITINMSNWFYYLFESPVAGPLWYILGILILQIFAPIIVRFKNHKKLISSVLVITIVYIFLRNFGVVPRFLEFKNWWWYNNLISYAPAYILGAYIGLYYPNIILNKEYCEKKYTYIGIFLVFISLVLCYFTSQWKINLVIIYTFIELVGLWFIFKPKIFSKNIPEFFRCNFYIFALHNPILIPITQFFIRLFFQNVTFCGIGVIVVKIIQIIIIVLICAIIRFIIRKLSPFIDKCLTGGR